MAVYSANLNGSSFNTHRIDLHVNVASQNIAGNTSTVSWALYLVHTGPSNSSAGSWRTANDSAWSATIGPHKPGGATNYDFRGNLFGSKLLGSGSYTLTHNNDGTLTIPVAAAWSTPGNIGNASLSATFTLPAIPRMPTAPRNLTVTSVGATSVGLGWQIPSNIGGSALIEYEVDYGTGTATITAPATTGTVPGLNPGQSYSLRLRVRNTQGWSPWSNTVTARPVLPAPTFTSWVQNSAGELVGIWTPPADTTGLLGYRLRIARDAAFTQGVQLIDLGNTLTHAVAGLPGGRTYYAQIAARTAAGTNTYSDARNTMLVLDAGNIDGWTRVGTKPAQIAYFTTEGLRRGTIGVKPALLLESLSTASVTLPADTFGIQKVVTGLQVGKAYRFQANATLTGAPQATTYRLRVIAESSATPVVVTDTLTDLGWIEFVADATTVTIQILLAQTVTITGEVEEVERLAVTDVRLLELATDYPVRLRETVYESNLANHFDLACNSVGATWYVGRDGVTRFRLPGTALPVSAIFSDEADQDALHYVDVIAGHDTKSLVNRLDVTNYGVDEERENEENDNLIVTEEDSITAYGVRSSRLDMNLWGEPPYDESLEDRLQLILNTSNTPHLLISQVRWNAQENLAMAEALDVGQRVLVRYRGLVQDSQIVNLTHTITPQRWMVTAGLQRL